MVKLRLFQFILGDVPIGTADKILKRTGIKNIFK